MRRFSVRTFAAAALLALPVCANAQTADDCFQATLKDDDLEVIRICTLALEKGGMNDKDRSITVSNRGLGYLRNKEYEKAIADVSEAIRIDPNNPYAYNSRGDAWLQKGDIERAFTDFNEALRIDPDFTGAMYNRGVAFEKRGNKPAAREEFRKALATTGTRALDKWSRARARERLADLGDNPPQEQPKQPPSSNGRSTTNQGGTEGGFHPKR